KRAVLRHSLAVDMAARQAAKVFQENGTASCEQTGMLLCHPPGLHHQYALRGPSDTDGQRKPSILKTAVFIGQLQFQHASSCGYVHVTCQPGQRAPTLLALKMGLRAIARPSRSRVARPARPARGDWAGLVFHEQA